LATPEAFAQLHGNKIADAYDDAIHITFVEFFRFSMGG